MKIIIIILIITILIGRPKVGPWIDSLQHLIPVKGARLVGDNGLIQVKAQVVMRQAEQYPYSD